MLHCLTLHLWMLHYINVMMHYLCCTISILHYLMLHCFDIVLFYIALVAVALVVIAIVIAALFDIALLQYFTIRCCIVLMLHYLVLH